MQILVMGSGGVGGYFGGLLARAGEDLTFIARGEHLAALQAQGLRIESPKGDFVIQPVQAGEDPATVGIVDLVLVATKSYNLEEVAAQFKPCLGPETAVLPLQNGVDASERLATILDPRSVLGGVCYIISHIAEPGLIRHGGLERIVFGELDGQITPRVEAIAATLQAAGIEAEASTQINQERWTKFLFITAISGVGAVTRVPIDEIVGCPEARQLLESSMREVEALARANGVRLDEDIVPRTMSLCEGVAPGVTASMHRDIVAGRPSELESQNGYVVREGLRLGVSVPTHTFIYGALLPQERRAQAASGTLPSRKTSSG